MTMQHIKPRVSRVTFWPAGKDLTARVVGPWEGERYVLVDAANPRRVVRSSEDWGDGPSPEIVEMICAYLVERHGFEIEGVG